MKETIQLVSVAKPPTLLACVALVLLWPLGPVIGQQDVKKPSPLGDIVGGVVEEDYEAVGALVLEGEVICTGTLIEDDIVVTAAHCFGEDTPPSALSFFVGQSIEDREAGESLRVANVQVHPGYDSEKVINDIAIMVLREKTDVLPIPYRRRALSKGFVGRKLLYVGYGATSGLGTGGGVKRSVVIPTHEVNPKTIAFDDFFEKNTCFGDSGGPAIDTQDDEPTLIGVTSHGDFLCALSGVSTRADAHDDFIREAIERGRKVGVEDTRGDTDEDDLDPYDEECCGCSVTTGSQGHTSALFVLVLLLWAGRKTRRSL